MVRSGGGGGVLLPVLACRVPLIVVGHLLLPPLYLLLSLFFTCSRLETPKAEASLSALWPMVSLVENSAIAGSSSPMSLSFSFDSSFSRPAGSFTFL